MNIQFQTNIDHYTTAAWPVLDVVPRKGEIIEVHPSFKSYCESRNIPNKLEVVQVTYSAYNYTYIVKVELWYREIDVKMYKKEDLF